MLTMKKLAGNSRNDPIEYKGLRHRHIPAMTGSPREATAADLPTAEPLIVFSRLVSRRIMTGGMALSIGGFCVSPGVRLQ
jgi:hypothetical protein